MKRIRFVVCFLLAVLCINTATAFDVGRISKENLRQMIAEAKPVVIDVRIEKHWKASEFKIKGAFRGNPKDFDAWVNIHSKNAVLVLYCA